MSLSQPFIDLEESKEVATRDHAWLSRTMTAIELSVLHFLAPVYPTYLSPTRQSVKLKCYDRSP